MPLATSSAETVYAIDERGRLSRLGGTIGDSRVRRVGIVTIASSVWEQLSPGAVDAVLDLLGRLTIHSETYDYIQKKTIIAVEGPGVAPGVAYNITLTETGNGVRATLAAP